MQPSPQSNFRTVLPPAKKKKKAALPFAVSCHSSRPHPLATVDLLFLPMDLPILDISYKGNHTLRGGLFCVFLTWHCVCKVYACFIIYQSVIHFYCQTIFHCIEIHYVYSSGDGYLGYFHSLAIINNAAMDIRVQVFVWTHVFVSLKYIPRRTLLGHHWYFKFFILVTLAKEVNLCPCYIADISDVNRLKKLLIKETTLLSFVAEYER